MENDAPVKELAVQLGIQLKENDFAANRQAMANAVNQLLQSDFQKLVSLLYRLDVSESKLRLLLKEYPTTDAGLLIADLMIERESQKIRSKQQFRQPDNNIDENEKW